MPWTLAPNLAKRSTAIKGCYPGTVVYALGDTAHQATHSDHNKDSRGVVHAIDVMLVAGTPKAIATLKWLLSDTTDLQYVIHNHKIYSRSNGFAPKAYSGTDPHTNHIHVSGKHGTVGASAGTGIGYDVTAEAYRPKHSPCYIAPPKYPGVVLKLGSKGASVKLVQARLKITADGDFGPKTQAAVKAFQKSHGLTVDGEVGPLTWSRLF